MGEGMFLSGKISFRLGLPRVCTSPLTFYFASEVMLSYVLKRFLQSILVMLFVAFVCFVLSNYVGDPVNNMVGQEATIADRAALRQELGLNDPVVFQFGRFVSRAVQGDFGISYRQQRPVKVLLQERLPATLELVLISAILALCVGIPCGVYTGL